VGQNFEIPEHDGQKDHHCRESHGDDHEKTDKPEKPELVQKPCPPAFKTETSIAHIFFGKQGS
jgi:hypothetical protein